MSSVNREVLSKKYLTSVLSKNTIEVLGSWLSGGGYVNETLMTDKIKEEVKKIKNPEIGSYSL